jgi:hypothetical protein
MDLTSLGKTLLGVHVPDSLTPPFPFVVQDFDGRAADIAIGWAIAVGAPFAFGSPPLILSLVTSNSCPLAKEAWRCLCCYFTVAYYRLVLEGESIGRQFTRQGFKAEEGL